MRIQQGHHNCTPRQQQGWAGGSCRLLVRMGSKTEALLPAATNMTAHNESHFQAMCGTAAWNVIVSLIQISCNSTAWRVGPAGARFA